MTKVLLALDCSPQAQKVVDYVAGILPHLPACRAILFSVLTGVPYGEEDIAAMISTPQEPEVHGDEDHRQEAVQARACLNGAAARLQQAGLTADRLELVMRPERRGVARDILDAVAEFGCDTLVAGRRGQNRMRDLLQGSVARELVQKGDSLTIWIVE